MLLTRWSQRASYHHLLLHPQRWYKPELCLSSLRSTHSTFMFTPNSRDSKNCTSFIRRPSSNSSSNTWVNFCFNFFFVSWWVQITNPHVRTYLCAFVRFCLRINIWMLNKKSSFTIYTNERDYVRLEHCVIEIETMRKWAAVTLFGLVWFSSKNNKAAMGDEGYIDLIRGICVDGR